MTAPKHNLSNNEVAEIEKILLGFMDYANAERDVDEWINHATQQIQNLIQKAVNETIEQYVLATAPLTIKVDKFGNPTPPTIKRKGLKNE